MRDFLYITKAVAEETRLRILMVLREGELCVCQIVDVLDLAPSTVSKHMAILAQAGVVDVRKAGRWRYYRLADQDAPNTIQNALTWVHSSLINSPQIREDAKRLKTVKRKEPRGCQRPEDSTAQRRKGTI